jgi:hypothetical protein
MPPYPYCNQISWNKEVKKEKNMSMKAISDVQR